MPTVQEILDQDFADPTFALRPRQKAPLPGTFTRGGAEQVFAPQKKYIKKGDGVPAYRGGEQQLQALTGTTQIISSGDPQDPATWNNPPANGTAAGGTALGKNYVELTGTDSFNHADTVSEKFPTNFCVVRSSGRIRVRIELFDSSTSTSKDFWVDVDLSTGDVVGQEDSSSVASIIQTRADYLEDGFYICGLVIEVGDPTTWEINRIRYQLADSVTYDWIVGQGDGSAQIQSPIFTSGAVRNTPRLDFEVFDGFSRTSGTWLLDFYSIRPRPFWQENGKVVLFKKSDTTVRIFRLHQNNTDFFYKMPDGTTGNVGTVTGQTRWRWAMTYDTNGEQAYAQSENTTYKTSSSSGGGFPNISTFSLIGTGLLINSLTYRPEGYVNDQTALDILTTVP